MKKQIILTSATLLAATSIQSTNKENPASENRPNILLILVDDMGYSDISCFGGEIDTPNLNNLAANGLRYTQFYNGARSCPSRAALMTGLHPHMTGIGWMTDRNLGYQGYTGELSKNCVTIAEVLKSAGYSTYMAGKWHLTSTANIYQNGNKTNWPRQRGYDHFFGTIDGAGSYWDPYSLKLENDSISSKNYKNFFYTDKIAEYTIKFINDHITKKNKNPFFSYVAFTSPHWPLHARPKTIEKYMERYKNGWDILRKERYERMIKMGLISSEWPLTIRDREAPAWDSLNETEKKEMAKRMAIYAAMVDEMDQAVGKIILSLKKNKQLDNTLILFLSDNGACAEKISQKDKSYEALGTASSFESYRLPWANASNTPFRLFKHWVHEGGISTPLVIHWPEGIKSKGEFRRQPYYLIDIMATCVDIGKAIYPQYYNGNTIPKMEGISLKKTFDNSPEEERFMFWEHEANCAARKGKWKIVSRANYKYPFMNKWELYNMEEDRTETHNIADEYPEIVTELSEAWVHWAESHEVYPLDGRIHGARVKNPIFNFPIGAKMPD